MPSGVGPVLCVVGARPNYMKMAPLLRAIKSRSDLPSAVWFIPGSTTTLS